MPKQKNPPGRKAQGGNKKVSHIALVPQITLSVAFL